MLRYILRRVVQAGLTIVGVMLFTFLLFRVNPGDIAAANLGQKATEERKANFRHKHGYDRPLVVNIHRNLLITDHTDGNRPLSVRDIGSSQAAKALGLILGHPVEEPRKPTEDEANQPRKSNVMMGRYVWELGLDTPIADLTANQPLIPPAGRSQATNPESATIPPAPAAPTEPPAPPAPAPAMVFILGTGDKLVIDIAGIATAGDLMQRINNAPGNKGRLVATISEWDFAQLFNSQFFRHLKTSMLFEAQSYKDEKKLTQIIAEKAPYSLAVQIPAMALEWCIGLAVACFVAYYRGSSIDKLGVFLSVLGMCIPFLAFMIFGQWLMFALGFPQHAFGITPRGNVYVPVVIMVIAGLGGQVRFYRTVILDETGRDYVRTAKAKGLPLPTILFKHVLKNCMLPILTSLILTIPFLIMGSLLVESFFGIPGLGDLMLTSIQDRNESIMNGLVFLTALIYTVGILLTDISYAIFDPRIRLQ